MEKTVEDKIRLGFQQNLMNLCVNRLRLEMYGRMDTLFKDGAAGKCGMRMVGRNRVKKEVKE